MDEFRPLGLTSILAQLALLALLIGCVGNVAVDGPGGADAGSSAPVVTFRPTVLDDMNSAGCTTSSCHGGGVVPMHITPFPSTDQQWLDNYNETRTRASTLLITKATDINHQASMNADDPVILRWRAWIDGGTVFELEEEIPDAGVTPDAPTSNGDGGTVPESLSWNGLIHSIMITEGCTGCHGQSGAYSLQTYQAALGFGRDSTPNVIPGAASSLLITYCENGHKGGMDPANADLVRQWIVDYNAAEN